MKKIHIRTKQAIGMLIAVSTGLAFMLLLFSALDLDTPPAADYIRHAITDTGSINIPSAILLDYRGFDTLGEASVIFTAATVVLVILGTPRFTEPDNTLGILTRRAIAYLLPLFLVFP
ncbi:MAG: hydrogen gas-evolving membrane-bound hydrogenase subunit E, partial [Spirochaeta sp.]